MVNPVKTTARPIIPPEPKIEHKSMPGATAYENLDYQAKPGAPNVLLYVVLAIAVLVGGYYLYTNEGSSPAVTSTMTKTDMAPATNAPATSPTVAPATPVAPTPMAKSTTDTPAAPQAVTPPASGTTEAPATPTKP